MTYITYKGCRITIGQDDIDPHQWNYSVHLGSETIYSSMKAENFKTVYHYLKGLIDDGLIFKSDMRE